MLGPVPSLMRPCSYRVREHVVLSYGVQYSLQAYLSIVSRWLLPPQQPCYYFLRITTHFAKLTFGVSTWFVHF